MTVCPATSFKKVVALMTLKWSRNGKTFNFYFDFFSTRLMEVIVVVIDNIPAHHLAVIKPFVQVAG